MPVTDGHGFNWRRPRVNRTTRDRATVECVFSHEVCIGKTNGAYTHGNVVLRQEVSVSRDARFKW
jgi:hypothetical protein